MVAWVNRTSEVLAPNPVRRSVRSPRGRGEEPDLHGTVPRQTVPLSRTGPTDPGPGPSATRRTGPDAADRRHRTRPGTSYGHLDGHRIDLSVKEFALLEALLRASPAFLSAEKLLEQVWDENADPFTNTVTVTIGRLRRKLGQPPVITTTPGVGYRIAEAR
ncbi:hypothetical protein GCM10027290_24080 [Micromonospora sonneratiae]